jgi:hypothetical protein
MPAEPPAIPLRVPAIAEQAAIRSRRRFDDIF